MAEREYQRLQTQAKEAQRIQEEALIAKESLTNHLERQCKLKRAETDLEVAKLVSSLLSRDLSLDTAEAEGPPDPAVPPIRSLHASQVQPPLFHQSPTQTVPVALWDSNRGQSTPEAPQPTSMLSMASQDPAQLSAVTFIQA